MRDARPISWIKAARKNFERFPEDVQSDMLDALTLAAEGQMSCKAKPFKLIFDSRRNEVVDIERESALRRCRGTTLRSFGVD